MAWKSFPCGTSPIASTPSSAPSRHRFAQAADAAVKALGWKLPYFCDADHITSATVGRFIDSCDFFTLDVADFIGQPAPAAEIDSFVNRHPELTGHHSARRRQTSLSTSRAETVQQTAQKFLAAVKKAGEVYRIIEKAKGAGNFIPEVSMDETDRAQSPVELLIILAAIADEGIPVQTIAPKFSGRFNKGVDYVGNVPQFETRDGARRGRHRLRRQAIWPARQSQAQRALRQRQVLHLSLHSRRHAAHWCGVHLKTAGTTWLEELIGLAEAGGEGLALAKEVYAEALAHREELCGPYAAVIDIDPARLPSAAEVNGWTSEQYTSALRHVEDAPEYNSSLRQLLHVGFKVAAKMGAPLSRPARSQ